MLEIVEDFGFVNETLIPVDQISEFLEFKGRPVYEVIRLIDSIPLFFNDHMDRLLQSCQIVGLEPVIEPERIRHRIRLLAETCGKQQGNLKIVYGESSKTGGWQLLIAFIPYFIPLPVMYEKGVTVTMLHMERPNPNAKLVKEKPRALHELIDYEKGFYEVLMVNAENLITEGSRSNVFFIKQDTLYTSPVETVLPGITRKKVLQIIAEEGLTMQFQGIRDDQVNEFDALFLTGTSPGVLPVRAINKVTFNPRHPLVLKIMQRYQQLLLDSMQEYGK